ncbi:MAG: DNA polymerase IV [Trueperaceae bacterium]
MNPRKIVHVDMDAFFASVEQRDHPHLRGRPVAVGGRGARAVVAAASYEARKFGVHSALPMRRALRLCPELEVMPARFDVYRQVSEQVRAIFLEYTDLVEPLALDEAFLDVTEPIKGPPSATLIAKAIKAAIRERTGLTASAGVATGKFLAKVASGMQKPDGLTVILPQEEDAFLAALPVGRFFGVGPATEERMHALGLRTGADLRAHGPEALEREFGKTGRFFYDIASGRDDRRVQPDRERKSIGAETTFEQDRFGEAELGPVLTALADEVVARMTRAALLGRTVTVKLRFADFTTITRSHTSLSPLLEFSEVLAVARRLAFESDRPHGPIRLLGVTVSQLQPAGTVFQPRLDFGQTASDEEQGSGARWPRTYET